MKFRHFLMTVLAVTAFAASCKQEKDLGAAQISVDPESITLESEAGSSQTIDLLATRKWSISSSATWLSFSPNGGEASADKQKVTITAKANPGTDRTAKVKFSIGLSEAVLTVSQKGEAGSEEEALVYRNNFDKEDAVDNSGWPTLDKSDCWKNEEGYGKEEVKYEFKGISARQSGKLSNDKDPKYSKYEGSGHNKLFFGSNAMFAVKEIALGGKSSFALSFGGNRYSMDDTDNTFNWNEFKVYVSIDGVKGVELPCTFAAGEAPIGAWDLAEGKFTVPSGTEKLTVVFKVVDTKAASKYSIDDMKLIASAGGEALDFSKAVSLGLDMSDQIPDTEDVTSLADVIKTAPGTQVTVTNATVTAVNTRGYIISDGTVHIYVYIGKDANHGLKIGDKASIIGTFKYYKGEYEIVDASQKKVGTATPAYPEPEELTPAKLNEYRVATPTDEDSKGYTGPWYPIYVKCTATVKKEGSYTNFIVEGYDKMLSLAFADSAMYKDESGTEYSDGNEVEIVGYLLPWEAKTATSSNEYHPILAISLSGEATWNPVPATLTGDDVFVSPNVAHDNGITNGNAPSAPITIGDATFSFGGGGNNGKYYDVGSGFRIYGGGSLKIESPLKIVKIEYLFAPKENNNTYMPDATDVVDGGTLTIDAENSKAVWAGSANAVTITRPSGSGQWRVKEVAVTYDPNSATEPRLAASPASIPVKADATSAKFNIQSNIAWSIVSDNPDFVAAPASGENNAEVTVTFPANESLESDVVAHLTISGDDVDDVVVTITQAKAVDVSQTTDLLTIWELDNNAEVEMYNVFVSAVSYKNYIVTDGIAAVYIYANSTSHGRKIGDKVNITGKVSWYNGLLEITGPQTKLVSEGNEVPYPAPIELDGETLNSLAAPANNSPFYATFSAKTVVNGNYLQFTPEGANNYISFADMVNADKQKFNEGDEVTVLGYYDSWNSKNNYHQFIYVSHEISGEAAPYLRVNNNTLNVAADAEGTSFIVYTNVEGWTAVSDNQECVVDYTTAGEGVVMVSFPVNESTEAAKVYHVTVSAEGVSDVVVTITVAKAKGDTPGGSWVRVASVSDITSGGSFIIGYEATANSGVIVPMRNDAGTASTTKDGYIFSGTSTEASGTGTIDMADVDDVSAYIVEMSASSVSGAVDIKLGDNYLGLRNSTSSSSNKNTCRLYSEASAKTAFKVTAGANSAFQFKCEHTDQPEYNTLQYNTSKGSERFSLYKGTQANPVVYKLVTE
ncbi:MAG: hypothetical protein IKR69_04560 [Bacteroidales bacterium]|nr:hypothetical protein [Bacteroidales bacterium]